MTFREINWARFLLFVFTALTLAVQETHAGSPKQKKHPPGSPRAIARKPNIVLMLMDNLGYGELGIYGGGILRGAPTPRIDKLASEGTRLFNSTWRPSALPPVPR